MTPFQLANTLEAGLWIAMSAVVLFAAPKRGLSPSLTRLLAVTLCVFGLSDLVETQTGAWYRPWWLFLWKASCVATLLAILLTASRKPKR